MKNQPFTLLLVGLFMLSALATLGLAVRYAWLVRDVHHLQMQAAVAQRDRALVTALANDAFEYGRRNTAIQPILESVGIRLRAGATNLPAAQQPGRP